MLYALTLMAIVVAGIFIVSVSAVFCLKWASGSVRFRLPHRQPKKKPMVPKTALMEAGICQCNDALCYHDAKGGCGVSGCPCRHYVPSDVDPQALTQFLQGSLQKALGPTVEPPVEIVDARTKGLRPSSAEARLAEVDDTVGRRARRTGVNDYGPDRFENYQ